MKSEWQLERKLVARSDGQRRWDCAYQLLLGWAMEHSTKVHNIPSPNQEDNRDRDCIICSSFDQGTTTEPKHGAAN
jgi:hypothetical protein